MPNVDFYPGSAIANANGVATLPVTLDPVYVRVHHVQAIVVGPQGQPRNLQQPITVATPPALASTGFPTWPITTFALLLIVAGAGLLTLHCRRSRGEASHL